MVVAWVELEWKGNKPQSRRPSAGTSYDPEEMIAAFHRSEGRVPQQHNVFPYSHLRPPLSSQPPPKTDLLTISGKFYINSFNSMALNSTTIRKPSNLSHAPAYVAKTFPYSSSRYLTQRYLLTIFDPADSHIDMGSKAYGIKNVQASFKEAYTLLSNTKRQCGGLLSRYGRPRGLLGDIFGGDFTDFEAKRAKISRLGAVRRYY